MQAALPGAGDTRSARRRRRGAILATLTAAFLFIVAAIPAGAMTVTFIRHGESYGNYNNSIDTSIPGPNLTPLGEDQSDDVADYLQSADFVNKYGEIDAIYASTMIRTQQTAQPLSTATGLPVAIIGYPKNDDAGEFIGVQEIRAGIFEGLPEKDGIGRIGYIVAPLMWTMGLYFVPIPGGESGLEFNERMTNAMKQIEEDTEAGADGEANAAVFSHGATIMMWTMMNVDNPDLLLLAQHQLANTDVVVVTQNDRGGWHLESWAGTEVGEANYFTKMFVNVRDLIVAPQVAVYNLRKPVLTPDLEGIADGVVQGVRDVGQAGINFVRYSVEDTVDAIGGLVPSSMSTPLNINANRSSVETLSEAKADTKTQDKTPLASVTSLRSKLQKELDAAKAEISDLTAKASGKSSTAKALGGDKASDPAKAISDVRDRVRTTVTEARDSVKQSIKDTRIAVRKAVGADRDAA